MEGQDKLDQIIGNWLAKEHERFYEHEASQKILLHTATSLAGRPSIAWTILRGTVHTCFETVFKGALSWLFSR